MNMKTFNFFCRGTALAALLVLLAACDNGFDALNTDKTRLTELEPALQLNRAIVNSAIDFNNLVCETTVVRQGVIPFSGFFDCANFNVDSKQAASTNWNRYYGSDGIRELTDAIRTSSPDENVHHMARIWRAYNFMVLTDTYGDVPYTEAGLGFREGVAFPAYDAQEAIYTGPDGILAELAEASAALELGAPADGRVLLYGGNPAQWQRLGYSLLLRAAMRLSKVQPNTAQQYAQIAVAGGLMTSNADNAVIRHTPDYRNPIGTQLTGGEAANYYLDEVFVTHLQENDDPRLAAIAVRYPTAASGSQQTAANADRSPGNQVGMPQGYNANTIVPIAQAAGLPSLFAYSQVDRTRMSGADAPTFLVTYAQTLLLQAEAVARGWVQGNAATLFSNAIEAHMQQLAAYGATTAIPQADIDAYVAAHPYDPARAMEQINTEYWVASFLNGPEAWANFRRSGYPELPANPLRGSLESESFIRRFTYPDAEQSINAENLAIAAGRQGPDRIDTRVWWDRP